MSLLDTVRPHRVRTTIPILSSLILTNLMLAWPCAAAPVLSDPIYLPGDDVIAPAAGKQLNPEIAAGSDMYLAVWVDDRAGITEMTVFSGGLAFDHHVGTMWDIYAARIDAAGSLIDQTPIVVNQDLQNQGLVDVAWNGTNWLVTWSGASGLVCCPQVDRYAARVSPDGTVLDSTPIVVATGATFANAYWPAAVGSNGSDWLVVWTSQQTTGQNEVVGVRVAADGTVLDPAGVILHTGGFPGDFDLVSAGGEYFLVWSDGGMASGGTVLGRRLNPDLSPVGPAFPINLYSPSTGLNTRVATDGTDYLVTWWEDRYSGWSQLAGARVSHDGVVLDPAGLQLTAASGYTSYEPAVDWDGSNYVVVYAKSNSPPIDLFATRVSAAGVVRDFDTSAIPVSTAPNAQTEAAIAYLPGASSSLVAWRDTRYHPGGYVGSLGDIFTTTLTPGGTVGPDRCVSVGMPRQTRLRVVPNDSGYLAVFRSETSLGVRILAQRLDADGQAIDPEPVEVGSGGLAVKSPAVAWDGSEYLVVWENETANQVYGRRMDATLGPIDPAPVALMPGNTPDVAADGGVFLVVTSYESPPEIRQIYSLRVRGSDGAVLDGTPRTVGASFSLTPRATGFAGSWVVVWEQHPTHDDPFSVGYARFVAPDGVPGSTFGLLGGAELPTIASGATTAFAAWEDRGATPLDIIAARVATDGTLLDPFPGLQLTAALNAQFDAAVAWTGAEYVVAFGDFRNEGALDSQLGDLYGTRVTEAGVILDPDAFPIFDGAGPEMFPDVAGRDGGFVAGGSVFRPDPGIVSYRIAFRSSGGAVGSPGPDAAGAAAVSLASPRPNPLRTGTTVTFTLPDPMEARLAVYDATGRLVRSLVSDLLSSGAHVIPWDGRDQAGKPVGAGVYFARLEAGGAVASRRIVVMR